MSTLDSPVDRVALKRARALLKAPTAPEPTLAAVAAAAFFAISALSLAMVVIVLPPVLSTAQPGPAKPAG
jgi:hypothetical protein